MADDSRLLKIKRRGRRIGDGSTRIVRDKKTGKEKIALRKSFREWLTGELSSSDSSGPVDLVQQSSSSLLVRLPIQTEHSVYTYILTCYTMHEICRVNLKQNLPEACKK